MSNYTKTLNPNYAAFLNRDKKKSHKIARVADRIHDDDTALLKHTRSLIKTEKEAHNVCIFYCRFFGEIVRFFIAKKSFE